MLDVFAGADNQWHGADAIPANRQYQTMTFTLRNFQDSTGKSPSSWGQFDTCG
jgi:hypothetical protein